MSSSEKSAKPKTDKSYTGGALSGYKIKKLLKESNSDSRLVISPILEIDEQIRDDQASIDVRLGCQFVLTQTSALGEINEFSSTENLVVQRRYSELYVPLGRSLVIHPHQFILASTLEYFRLPGNLMCYVVGRSTWGRLGLIIATAVGVHPGFSGTLTLEIRNLGETPLRLYPGQSIAQLFFHYVETNKTSKESSSQYPATVDLFPRNISGPRTKAKLSEFIKANRF